MLTDDYSNETEQEQRIELGNGEKQRQNQNQEQKQGVENGSVESDSESLLIEIEPRIQDCGLNPVHSKSIGGT